jgi:transposase-like protein
VDSHGEAADFYYQKTRDREPAKIFLKRALANQTIANRAFWVETASRVIRLPFVNYLYAAGLRFRSSA